MNTAFGAKKKKNQDFSNSFGIKNGKEKKAVKIPGLKEYERRRRKKWSRNVNRETCSRLINKRGCASWFFVFVKKKIAAKYK